jgi:peptidoglycan hydrolase-like protein with peptidoglycan-binding domain
VKLNSTGDLVKYLQGVLNKKGAKLALDGFFGPVTNTAVKAYQTATHIVVDGIVGAQTWAKIDYDALH